MKIALVYDRVNKWGGAERVLLALHEIWPQAPLYTAVYDPKGASWAEDFRVIPSFLQKIPFAQSRHELLAPLMPIAFESFDFDKYDVIISVTSEAAKGIITKPKTLHICYCLTPTRYLWSGYNDYFRSSVLKFFSFPLVSYLRRWDQMAAQRPDHYIAISENVQKRIKKYYKREAKVVYPPIDTKKFEIRNSKQTQNSKLKTQNSKLHTTYSIPHTRYFLVVSRLVPYKRIDIAIEVFNELGWPLKIVGVGSEAKKLRKIARQNIEFLGQLTDGELIGYYQGCQAVIFPQEEDFGLVPLEAQACGKPVIAFQGGGALETVIGGKTGIFFYPQTAEALIKGIKGLKGLKLKEKDCRRQAERFSKEKFKKKFKNLVGKLVKQNQK